jgi:hypothetical protein
VILEVAELNVMPGFVYNHALNHQRLCKKDSLLGIIGNGWKIESKSFANYRL